MNFLAIKIFKYGNNDIYLQSNNLDMNLKYDVKELCQKALNYIQMWDLVYIQDVVAYLPISSQVFYVYFPVDSEEYKVIKEALDNNKSTLKIQIRNKLLKSNKAAELIALYKLLSTDEERKALSMKYSEQHVTIKSELESMSDEQLAEYYLKLSSQQHSQDLEGDQSQAST